MIDISSQQHFDVQWYYRHVLVARQRGALPHPKSGYVLIKMIACGICGADIRAVTGDKHVDADSHRHVTLGHEGVGHVFAVGNDVSGFDEGDCVVILPHVLPSSRRTVDGLSEYGQVNPVTIGHHETQHMGWDIDGCFADYVTVPAQNLIRVDPSYLHQAQISAPDLREAVFALTEPLLCTLTAYELMEEYMQKLVQQHLTPRRAMVIGCGPIGMLHAIVLLHRGFDVWMTDEQEKRASMAKWLLDHQVQITLNSTELAGQFDLVVATPSSAGAIRMGETVVRDHGLLYLFAGLNTDERKAMDSEQAFFYEKIHRNAMGILTTTRLVSGEKTILYLGHSGYYQTLAHEAIAMVAACADRLERIVSGVIRGWSSSTIEARLPGGVDWVTDDGSPAVIPVLEGLDLRDRHCKLLVVAE